MDLQLRIKNIQDYFRGLEYVENFIIVKIEYKPKWEIFETKTEDIKITTDDVNHNLYFYYGDVTLDINQFFNLIEDTIKYNLEREEKVALLKSKIEEMKNIFLNEDIETLNTLTFSFKKKKKKITLSKKEKLNNNHDNVEFVENTNTIIVTEKTEEEICNG